ncbi:outer membrane efflux protein (plasmid) [Gemmatirosa kalamazoonensis]|uniref:Outer membrane efflux protein n=1 Tax=Gemmatirosa kalamazoonensis TaxID=861299 RepID=W0RTV0_9BACT|nr:TolC family protein [Gemmatirosa kalamazoonensis]AHG93023.1 outer membrane efflux protein [Gemmatirosa kalamazoonensis]
MSIHATSRHFRRVAPVAALIASLSPTRARAQEPSAGHLTLGGAARLAALRSAASAGAAARSAQADARTSQRRAELLPTLSTSAQLGARTTNSASLGIDFPTSAGNAPAFDPRGELIGPVHDMDLRARIAQRVVDVPAMLRWRAAAADADAARRTVAATADQAAERGAAAYVEVQRAEARIAAHLADSALAAELLDMARQQLAAGVAVSLDVTRAESQLADARARLITTRGQHERALLTLRRELALDASAPLGIADTLAAPPVVEPARSGDDAVREALAARADVRAAVASQDGAHLQARAALAEHLPTVQLFADHGATGRGTDRLLGTYAYGVQVSLPLFDGLRAESRAAEERAREREAETQLQDARRQVETEVRGALVDIATAREAVAAADVRLRLAEQEVAQARERFRAGVSGNADVISASMSLDGARDLVIDARAAYQRARVALAAARGDAATLP